jgi:hypothetical protein
VVKCLPSMSVAPSSNLSAMYTTYMPLHPSIHTPRGGPPGGGQVHPPAAGVELSRVPGAAQADEEGGEE